MLTSTHAAEFKWSRLPDLPDREGVAGAFAGVSGGTLLVAGGANFPEKKPWEGGVKVWHDTVFALAQPDDAWRILGKLTRPLAYGVSVTTPAGVLCIGGSDSREHYAEVFLLGVTNGGLETRKCPSLPTPLANGAGALLGSTAYVFGGSEKPGEKAALNRLFALDTAATNAPWKELPSCPGKPRLFPTAASVDGALYIAGGAALEETNGQVVRVYLRDVWCFRPDRSLWEQRADLPFPAVAAPSPAPVVGATFFVLGGDDGSLTGFQPVSAHPGFPRRVLCCDTRANAWSIRSDAPASRATLPAVWWRDGFVLPSGEVRPGVRSPEVWTLRWNP